MEGTLLHPVAHLSSRRSAWRRAAIACLSILAVGIFLVAEGNAADRRQKKQKLQVVPKVRQQKLQLNLRNQLPDNFVLNQQNVQANRFRQTGGLVSGREHARLDHRSIREMIDLGCGFIRSTQMQNGSFGNNLGETGLGALALLAAGADPKGDPVLARALDYLKTNKDNGQTYVHGVTANVWEYALRRYPADTTYRELLMHDAKWLMEALGKKTGWRYSKNSSDWDNSVTQYGVLGIWAACRGGFDPGEKFWRNRAAHFLKYQNRDGGWGYVASSSSSANMATAGLATQFLVYDKLFASDCYRPGQDDPFSTREAEKIWDSIERGMGWLGETAASQKGQSFGGYYNYGIERVGVASGRQRIGGVDWFRQGAEPLLKLQNANGSFNTHGHGGAIAQAGFNVLFLVYGGAPVAFNKLQYGNDANWNRNPRDLATLASSLWSAYERPLNWQSVELEDDQSDWEGAILFISGDEPVTFTAAQIEKLKAYIDRGGTVLAEPLPGGNRFRESMTRLSEHLALGQDEDSRLHPLGDDHQLYRCMPQKWRRKPRFQGLSDGARIVFFLSENYLSGEWQSGKTTEDDDAYKIALNLLYYAYDLGSPRPRYPFALPKTQPARKRERVCRLYRIHPEDAQSGDFQRALGMVRTKEYVLHATGIELDVRSGPLVRIETAAPHPDILHLTGMKKFSLSDKEGIALRERINDGAILLADSYASSPEFAASCRKELTALFGPFHPLSPDSRGSMAAGSFPGGEELHDLRYNLVARRELKKRGLHPRGQSLEVIHVNGRPAVFFSRVDLTGALSGVRSYRAGSYVPDSARRLLANLVAYATATTE
ncbi:MAG: DUF4159 domain-containing protein [Lentisphaeria bacterium]|nr:DUF4159 domain-containing protein [Lentisphaeria bacterium]